MTTKKKQLPMLTQIETMGGDLEYFQQTLTQISSFLSNLSTSKTTPKKILSTSKTTPNGMGNSMKKNNFKKHKSLDEKDLNKYGSIIKDMVKDIVSTFKKYPIALVLVIGIILVKIVTRK